MKDLRLVWCEEQTNGSGFEGSEQFSLAWRLSILLSRNSERSAKEDSLGD